MMEVTKISRRDPAAQARWKLYKRRSTLKKKYGISPEIYDALFTAQGGSCAICKTPASNGHGVRLAVDHDKNTGIVRGLLCGCCNRGIGYLKHDVRILSASIGYLA